MVRHHPDLLDRAEVALHCKDWLFLNLTGVRATDPSEASFTFGDFRDPPLQRYGHRGAGAVEQRHLLPDNLDGTQQTIPLGVLTPAAATGLRAGTPVSLGYVDMVMTALGAGVHTGDAGAACSTIGSTGVHMRAVDADNVQLNAQGYGLRHLPAGAGHGTQVQTNMAATLEHRLGAVAGRRSVGRTGGSPQPRADLVECGSTTWMARSSAPAALMYHPYISEAGERGPIRQRRRARKPDRA